MATNYLKRLSVIMYLCSTHLFETRCDNRTFNYFFFVLLKTTNHHVWVRNDGCYCCHYEGLIWNMWTLSWRVENISMLLGKGSFGFLFCSLLTSKKSDSPCPSRGRVTHHYKVICSCFRHGTYFDLFLVREKKY